MITELFKIALVTSLAGGALTLILALAHPFTRRRFSAGWNYYVWLAVIFVMLCPMRISLPERAKTAVIPPSRAVTRTVTPSDNTAVPTAAQTAPVRTARSGAVSALRTRAADKLDLLAYIWLIAAVVIFTARAVSYAAFRRRLKKSSRIIDLPELARYTKRRVTVRKSGGIISPLIVGVFRPVLLLPETELTGEQLHYVLLHEAAHLNRGDILYKWLAAVVKCVHWFNPAAYFMAARVNTECEISCDAAVTSGMTRGEEAAYVKTILALLSGGKRPVPLTTGMTGGKRILRRRFEMIRDKRDIGKRMRILSAALAVIMTASAALAGGVLADGVLGGVTIEITSNGEKVELANKPFTENGEVYLPLREIFDKLGLMNNEECYIEWNNGRIEFCIADKLNSADLSEDENTEFISVWAVEIGRNELIYNAFEHTSSETTQSFINAPVLKEDLTYIPYSYVEFLLNAASPKEWNISYSIYDKNGEITDMSDYFYHQFIGDGFSVKIPGSWSDKYIVNTEESDYGTSYSFIQKATYEKYGAGVLCSIEKVRREDADELLNMLGGSELLYSDENYAYIYEIPTDVQYPVWIDHDEEDVAIAAEYKEMFEQVDFIKNSFEMADHTDAALPFTDAEVAAARAVAEEYWRAKMAHDREAILKTVTEPNRADNMVYFSEGEKITLDDIRYDPSDSARADYIAYGRGSVNGTRYEDVIVFRVDYTVEDKGYSAYNEGQYTDWSMILIRDGRDGQWLIDDQGY